MNKEIQETEFIQIAEKYILPIAEKYQMLTTEEISILAEAFQAGVKYSVEVLGNE